MCHRRRIQEFKEAFNMIDQNRDGFIDQQDLQEMFASLGELHDGQWSSRVIDDDPEFRQGGHRGFHREDDQ